MAKVIQNQQAFIDNIQNIINESLHVTNVDHTEKFGIRRYIHGLIAEGSNDPKLMSYLTNWDNNLNESEEYKAFMEFGNGLSNFASGNASVKKTINKMNSVLESSGAELGIFLTIDKIQNPSLRKAVYESYNNYLSNPDYDSRNILMDSVDLLAESEPDLCIQLHRMVAENTNELPEINMYMNESDYDSIAAKIKRSNEARKLEEIKEKVTEYANQVFTAERQQAEAEQMELCLEGLANNNGIDLNQAIRHIAKSDASRNEKLMAKLDEYAGALNHGLYEERLYETFLLNMSQYEYLLPVEEAVKMIKENVNKNSLAIAITKILEEMQDSSSYYLVKMIEEDCARFVKEPTPQNRVQLRNILCPLAADPYCFKILETIDTDTSKQPSLEEQAMEINDQIKLVRENATISNLYSPIQYIKENECIFNANGKFYVKKGNQLTIIDEQYFAQLNPNFVSLCKLCNDPNVTINEDCIILNGVGKQAHIYEGYVDINGKRESRDTLRNLNEMYMKYDYDTNFFIMASCLHESFNKIAKINFAKHVTLNEDHGINLDLFRLADNIFINATNENIQSSTFYSNVNAFQCKDIINTHMGINVSSLFEDLIPSQDKIILKLNETQNEYEDSIKKYEEKIEQLEKAAKSCSDENKEKIEDKLKEAKEKLESLKKEYKEFQKSVKNKTEAHDEDSEKDTDDEVSGDGDVRDETNVQPMDDKEVEQNMQDLTTPIENGETTPTDDFENHETDEKGGLTDDEFAKLLDNGENSDGSDEFVDPNETPEETPEENPEENPEETPEENPEETPEENPEETPEETTGENPEETTGENPEETTGDENTIDFNEPEITGDDDEDLANIDADTEAFPEVTTDEPEEPAEPEEPTSEPVEPDELGDDEDFTMGPDAEVLTDEPVDDEGAGTAEPAIDPALTEPALDSDDLENVSFKIVNVLFDENVKTSEKYKSGTVSIVIPMVSREGNKYVKNVTYDFYLNAEDATPIIDNDEMSAELYNAICQAIQQDPAYQDIKENGIDKGSEETADVKNPEGLPTTTVTPEGNEETNGVDPFDGVDFSTDSIFNVTDTPDSFEITTNTDEPKVGDETETLPEPEVKTTVTPEEDENPKDDDTLDFIIPTYKSEDGKTDIELPAPNVDGTEIPESKKATGNKLNENRQKILGIKTNKSRFFVNESSNKLSEKKEQNNVSVSDTKIVGDVVNEEIVPSELNAIEDYDESLDIDVISILYNKACFGADYITKNSGHSVTVSPVTEWNVDSEPFKSFDIECDGQSYTIYEIGPAIYNRPSIEFYEIKKDLEDEVPGETIEALKMQYSQDEELDYVLKDNLEDATDMLNIVFSALTGENCTVSELSENCKIRVKRLSTGGDISDSKLVDDIHYGDKATRDFENKIELETQQAGVPNPLVQQPQQEAVEPEILPNIHMIREQLKNMIITYEPNDIVLYDGKKCKVMTVSEDGNTINIMIENGKTVDVEPKDLEPDPEYVNSLNILNQYDDKQHQLINSPHTDKKDIEGKTIDCNIIIDGLRLNCESYKASLEDIKNSKRNIRIMNEDGTVDEYNVDAVDFTEFPYAVIVNEEGKAVRSIQIDPQSYVTAGDDDLVRCWVAGKETQYPKKAINILS